MKIIYVTFLKIQRSVNKRFDHWNNHCSDFLFHYVTMRFIIGIKIYILRFLFLP